MKANIYPTLILALAVFPVYAAEEVTFTKIVTEVGFSSAPTSLYLIRDQQAWEKLWTQRHAGENPPPSLPSVDLEQKSIIGFYAGGRPSSGYMVQIKRIVEHTDKITLEIEEQVPADNCTVLAVVTSPYTFVAVDSSIGRKPLDFQLSVSAVSCGE